MISSIRLFRPLPRRRSKETSVWFAQPFPSRPLHLTLQRNKEMHPWPDHRLVAPLLKSGQSGLRGMAMSPCFKFNLDQNRNFRILQARRKQKQKKFSRHMHLHAYRLRKAVNRKHDHDVHSKRSKLINK